MSIAVFPDSFSLPATTLLRVTLRLLDRCCLPRFPGSELRGMVGQGLKLASCPAVDAARCKACPPELQSVCAYARWFEPHRGGGQGDPPRPFALRVPWLPRDPTTLPAGSELDLGLQLIGPAAAEPNLFVEALSLAGRRAWLGRGARARFEVESTAGGPVASLPSGWLRRVEELRSAKTLRIGLLSPLSLRESQGTLTWFDPERFLRFAFDRVASLSRCFTAPCSQLPVEEPGRDPELRVEQVATRSIRIIRMGRRGKQQPMDGIVGDIVLAGRLEPYLPLLVAAERYQVGRHTTSGFGVVQLQGLEQ